MSGSPPVTLVACVLALVGVGLASAQDPGPQTYRLTPESRLEVKTGKTGLFSFAGHEHVIRAGGFAGEILFDPAAPERSHVLISVRTDSLRVLTPPDTAEIRKVTEAMRTEVLRVDSFPLIRFVSRQVSSRQGGFRVEGDLTMVGQTRPVTVDLLVEIHGDSLRARGGFSVKQTDFGIKPYHGGPLGSIRVADRVDFTIDAIGVRPTGP